MGRKVKKIEVSAWNTKRLEERYHSGISVTESRRCPIVLLKLQGYSLSQIGAITPCCEMSINNRVNRFVTQGIGGLQTRRGQSRKSILTDEDLPLVQKAVAAERQRLSQAKEILETESGKRLSHKTLPRFLKVITAVTSASENG